MRWIYLVVILILVCEPARTQPPAEIIKSHPEPGEGIWSFLRRHQLSPAEYFDEFIQLNEGKFTDEGGLLAHHAYYVPTKITNWIEPLFGKSHQNLTLIDETLKGAVFFLVSGHGGPDPGAIGRYGEHLLYEDEYAYDITLRLAKNLMQSGAKVHVIVQDPYNGIRNEAILMPDQNETVMGKPIPLDQIERLKQRATAINQLWEKETASYQRVIEIHLDSRGNNQQLDVFFYHHPQSKTGREMAETLRRTFESNYRKHQPNRGFSGTVSPRNLYMLRYTQPVAVFVELGNIRNFRDQQRFILESNRQALANWLTAGIIEDFQNSK
ncbi:N-acetylmuramoyl-L-alanine amidase family protein [Natronoflexus pectinivorans]|uniref:N-acetylmuramoyl-L-alanine amidase n=1 Tax=Natronoflexus pectinivorans TaxID=682526 RepID=A0A4R2GGC0_9BACT|nr:N-acetylmuramoyl-L-alanine amidase [Natronoflexus pectinivorans]TCO07075.1 N-acetylmuramoyl-L-alanine amidase [Natronoflexus pectinivorans]